MKKISLNQYSVTLFICVKFDIAFAQIFNEYYLVVLQEKAVSLANISTRVIPSHRCRSIGELFVKRFGDEHLLKRMKSVVKNNSI